MTRGQAIYRAICAHMGLRPEARGAQARIVERLDGLVTQPQLSDWKRGARGPAQETVDEIGRRLGFVLKVSYIWEYVEPMAPADEDTGSGAR